jgi:hypothetical protein
VLPPYLVRDSHEVGNREVSVAGYVSGHYYNKPLADEQIGDIEPIALRQFWTDR